MGYRKRLTNKAPTIIASDCFGGIVYHNLGLEFKSPTINMYFLKEDFWEFVRNLKGYLASELVEVMDSDMEFPVGELKYNDKTINIYFMHYSSFSEAKEKWEERKTRIDFSNIYIIQLIPFATEMDVKTFDALPYKNKMLVTGANPTNSENVKTHEIFLKDDYHAGEILKYKKHFPIKRYMDDIDYVNFLNTHK